MCEMLETEAPSPLTGQNQPEAGVDEVDSSASDKLSHPLPVWLERVHRGPPV